jgi:Holliday junction DNA helicase RuvA
MIAYIHGNLTYKSLTQIIVDVGGIGYELQISLQTYEILKEEPSCKVFTYSHITQDAHVLYGFGNLEEKQWFLQLLTVNGIGPKVAMTILSALTPQDLQHAIMTNNIVTLQAIKGIGQKAAQRIILELQSKIGKVTVLSLQPSGQEAIYQEALAALAKLGIHKSIAEKTVASILKEYQGEISVESLIKLALRG